MIKSNDIKIVDIYSITPNPKNNNKHSSDQILRLSKIIQHNGFRVPLIVSNRSGLLISGHGRLEAAKLLEWKEVPVIFQDFKNEAEEIQFLTADNEIARWAELDKDLVKDFIADYGTEFDLDLLGIKDFELFESNEEKEEEEKELFDEEKYLIVIECEDELQQKDLFEEFQIRELNCKIMT